MTNQKIVRLAIACCFIAACLYPSSDAAAQSGLELVKKMHARYHHNWYRSLSFTQDTEIYRNDSLLRKSTWYEKARFPFELRIDVDSVNGGNKTLYKKDSTYRIRNYKIQAVTAETNPFIFFLGGMYMLPLDTVLQHFKLNGYDLSLGTSANWNGRNVQIIGTADAGDSSRNQVWVDAKDLYIVRIRLKSGKAMLDVQLSDHLKMKKGWSETNVKFYADGKLLQVERYRDLQPDLLIADAVFDERQFAR
ncbi:MAG: hypothetical protein EOO06_02020 [Chitinophagaceae bacterium]|nr:MAG: hypothetical protein EOO06_02020 [Chitinophagaceae bacterium]